MRECFIINRLLNASVLAGGRWHFSARVAQPQSGAVVRDFKNHAFPMAEERWSVAVAGIIQRLSEKVASLKIK
jgi:hypothetical protein